MKKFIGEMLYMMAVEIRLWAVRLIVPAAIIAVVAAVWYYTGVDVSEWFPKQ